MEELFNLIAKTYGIAGVLLLTPLFATLALWRQNQKLLVDFQAALERVNETHLKRAEDAKAVSDRLLVMVKEHAELSTETNLALDRVGDTLTIVQSNMKRQ
jgi:hypothetical protein